MSRPRGGFAHTSANERVARIIRPQIVSPSTVASAQRACIALALVGVTVGVCAQAPTELTPRPGLPGKDVIWLGSPEALVDAMRILRDELHYQQLMEIAGVDYPERADRFDVV